VLSAATPLSDGVTWVCGLRWATVPGGAERMRDALNEYFGNMIDMLTGHGADIVKFAGDAVIAVWQVNRATRSAGDTAALAAAVCLEMNAALDDYVCQAGAYTRPLLSST
jgi:class 3 adenylate cyclase